MNLDKIVGHKIFRNARLLSLKFIGIIGEDVMHILSSTTHDVRMCITISIFGRIKNYINCAGTASPGSPNHALLSPTLNTVCVRHLRRVLVYKVT